MNQKVDNVVESPEKGPAWRIQPGHRVGRGNTFLVSEQGCGRTGSDRPGGFDVFQRSVELDIAASVDPFAKAYAVINASADAQTGERIWESRKRRCRRPCCLGTWSLRPGGSSASLESSLTSTITSCRL